MTGRLGDFCTLIVFGLVVFCVVYKTELETAWKYRNQLSKGAALAGDLQKLGLL